MRSTINLWLFTGWENAVVANIATVEVRKKYLFISICVGDYNYGTKHRHCISKKMK